MDEKNNKILFRIKMRMRLNERNKQRKKLVKPALPRHDEVYFKGLEWLNNL